MTTIRQITPTCPMAPPPPVRRGRARRVRFLVYDGIDLLDLAGAREVLVLANMAGVPPEPRAMLAFAAERKQYVVETVSVGRRRRAVTHSGLAFTADRHIGECAAARGVTLIVPGGDVSRVTSSPEALAWIRRQASAAERTVSVCSGALALAAAGVLRRRRCTTHWMSLDELAAAERTAEIDRDAIFVRDGNIWTSAGGTAGIDLALALVEADLGHAASLWIARQLVVYLRRPGGQAQFSSVLRGQAAQRRPLRELAEWAEANPDADLSVAALARRAHMSPRNFTRVFTRETGVAPGRFVERLRVERAQRLLQESRGGVEEVASACGFGGPDTMRRAFLRIAGVPPSQYRQRFGPPPAVASAS